MTSSHELEFSFKARYFKAGDLNEATQHPWVVLHGYGQLPEYFIRKFSVVQNATSCVIAPEGLSKFYVNELKPDGNRSNDRVGASWMTKENRQTDIGNYLTYLNTVYDKRNCGVVYPKDYGPRILAGSSYRFALDTAK